MRNALGLMLASVVSAALIAAVWYWTSSPHAQLASAPATVTAAQAERLPAAAAAEDTVDVTAAIPGKPAAPSPAAAQSVVTAQPAAPCANPDALGVSRVVEVDTTGGPGFGFEHFKQLDFLTDKEVVLTFDDGPWPGNTPAVLKALADQCTKAVFFSIGKHATYHPEILKQVAAAGHTVGTHTWSHANLNSKKLTEQQVKDEIEKGFSAVKLALGAAPAPFFRFPELQHNPAAMAYLGQRNVAIFSCDLDSFDFRKASTPDKVVETVMTKLDKQGKGIILMHDFQKHTAEALPELLRRLKAGGYKVVQMKAKAPLETLAEYDELMLKDAKVPVSSTRPVNSVVQTVSK
ncbi:polysaccharide deacetylase family protein [Bradyrhizobium canariense]|uniref:Chitooligosaccharide deacetylase n=1 Tax=Bradyrhizobium canariense TaxID=255045 RepID=A0A1H1YZH6_9BRAD|nr:polysaccharide deacetylase family protein [Bradyrhizobium canariense]SDT26808.1 Peptidoglycan/xylan/chitin deacetylase, PgdA/CDA1 family [Bradyrhizobium canariense]